MDSSTLAVSKTTHKTISREDIFMNFIANKYGKYVPYVFGFAFATGVVLFSIFAFVFIGIEFVRYRDVEADMNSFASSTKSQSGS